MGCAVFANGMSIACKVASGKTIAAMPDVCLSPPTPPAGPVPIPYPNTAMASDTTNGSKTVQIGGDEVMLKDQSTFKQSSGDEAATKSLGMGVVSHQIQGEVNFAAWSMDVKFEGQNVPRHMDLTLHNEMCIPANTPTWPYLDSAAFAGSGPCKDVAKDVDDNCTKHIAVTGTGKVDRTASMQAMCDDKDCKKALKCVLSPKSPSNCCPQPQPEPPKATPHHIVPDSQFNFKGAGRLELASEGQYDYDKAPCICVPGTSHSTGLHGKIHTETNNLTVNHPSVVDDVVGKTISSDARWKVREAESVGAQAVAKKTKCDEACIKSQTRRGHSKMGIKRNDEIRPSTAGRVTRPPDAGASTY